jgi:hypothetical protein
MYMHTYNADVHLNALIAKAIGARASLLNKLQLTSFRRAKGTSDGPQLVVTHMVDAYCGVGLFSLAAAQHFTVRQLTHCATSEVEVHWSIFKHTE